MDNASLIHERRKYHQVTIAIKFIKLASVYPDFKCHLLLLENFFILLLLLHAHAKIGLVEFIQTWMQNRSSQFLDDPAH
jgi:hypothetical protein